MYLKLSVAGHLTIFLTRTRGPFWSIRPARILWMAVLGTQTIATLIAVYGVFMTPLGWKWAGFVWGYALIWFLINDRIKLLAYRIFDPVKVSTKPSDKDVPKLDSKAASKPEAKAEPKPEAKPEGKDSPKPEAKAESKPETKTEDKESPKPEAKVEPKPEAKPESKPDVKDDSKTETKVQPKPEPKTPPEATPQLVKRVHELYEQLGREDVKAVEEWEKANPDARKSAPDAAHK
jgi:H+-transporting ATPase